MHVQFLKHINIFLLKSYSLFVSSLVFILIKLEVQLDDYKQATKLHFIYLQRQVRTLNLHQ